MNYIVQSKKKGEKNWSGKEFSSHPAKIYTSFLDATQALEAYWFNNHVIGLNEQFDMRQIILIPLTEKEEREMLAFGKIRW